MTWDELKYFIKQQKEIGSEFMDSIHNESPNIYICTMVNTNNEDKYIRTKIKDVYFNFYKNGVIESGILMSSNKPGYCGEDCIFSENICENRTYSQMFNLIKILTEKNLTEGI